MLRMYGLLHAEVDCPFGRRTSGRFAAETHLRLAGFLAFVVGAFNSPNGLAAVPLNLASALEITVGPSRHEARFNSFTPQLAELSPTISSFGPLNAPGKTDEPGNEEPKALYSSCDGRPLPASQSPSAPPALDGGTGGVGSPRFVKASADSLFHEAGKGDGFPTALSDRGDQSVWVVPADERGVYGAGRSGPLLRDPRWRNPGWHDKAGMRRIFVSYAGN